MKEDDFKKKLNPEQYRVMRQDGNEAAYSGKYWDNEESGIYRCAACGNELFLSKDKFDSGTGWPSFHKPIDEKNLEYKKGADINGRIGIRCKSCHGNIGHLVSGKENYYRLNSVAMKFVPNNRLATLETGKDSAEAVKDNVDLVTSSQEQNANSRTFDPIIATTGGLAQLLGGGLVGLLVGASAGYFYCRTTCVAPTTLPLQVSTVAATTTQKVNTSTSSRRVIPSPSNAGSSTNTPLNATATQNSFGSQTAPATSTP